ncbi:bifunctional metallophosphatase/5'-nucleotidase [Vibrio sp.]|nr:bifunctional metallophosphatase/5'-nucleotidase [Vibrio sp.]
MTKPALSLTIAHINDTHSYFEPISLPLSIEIDGEHLTPYVSAGGFSRIKTKVEEMREEAILRERNFLFLHAGDCFQGTLFFSLFKGSANAHMLNELGIEAMTVGNHELDVGNDLFAAFAEQANFPILAGNWDLSNEIESKDLRLSTNPRVHSYNPDRAIASPIIKDIEGEKLAIFGLSLDRMADISNPDPDTPFVDSSHVAKNTVSYLNSLGINKIILLSHLGYEADKELAAEVDGISLIIGGHSHVLQGDYSAIGLEKLDDYGVKINNTYIVQSGFYGQAVGHCDIDFSDNGEVISFNGKNQLLLGRRLFIDADREEESQTKLYHKVCDLIDGHPLISVCRKDLNIQKILRENYLPQVQALDEDKLAVLDQKLRHVRIPDEKGPSDVAPLVAKSFYLATRRRGFPVQFGLHNAGGVRCSLQPGDITAADIAGKLLPFAIPIGVYFISGSSLRSTLEGAINNALSNGVEGTGTGSFPYCYGLEFEYVAQNAFNDRIRELKIWIDNAWVNIDDEKIYCGTSTAYTMKGKEGYDAIMKVVTPSQMTSVTMADAFIESMKLDKGFLKNTFLRPKHVPVLK